MIFKLIVENSSLFTHCAIALRWLQQSLTNEKWTLVNEMACYCQLPEQFWSKCMSPYGITKPQWVNGKYMMWCISQYSIESVSIWEDAPLLTSLHGKTNNCPVWAFQLRGKRISYQGWKEWKWSIGVSYWILCKAFLILPLYIPFYMNTECLFYQYNFWLYEFIMGSHAGVGCGAFLSILWKVSVFERMHHYWQALMAKQASGPVRVLYLRAKELAIKDVENGSGDIGVSYWTLHKKLFWTWTFSILSREYCPGHCTCLLTISASL